MRSASRGRTSLVEPDRVVMAVDGGDDLTSAAWEARSNAVARGLAARGVGVGDRVGLLFAGPDWVDFAVAATGVGKAGAVAVLLSAGATRAEVVRAVAHSGAAAVVCGTGFAAAGGWPVWAGTVGAVAGHHDTRPLAAQPDAHAYAQLVYPPEPMAPPRPIARTYEDRLGGLRPGAAGSFVHAWAPGSAGGGYALRLLRAGVGSPVVAVAPFDADRLCAAVAGYGAVGCGLTPALAAALLASGAAGRHDLSSVAHVVLSAEPSPATMGGLRAAFPSAAVPVLDGRGPSEAGLRGCAPVAVSQVGMLWHERFTPGSFNLPCLVRRYQGALDVAALGWALAELVRRHEPLRTTFAIVDGEPRQVVGDVPAATLAVTDLSALAAGDREATVADLLADATSRPFDLATGPLFEPRLLRLGSDDHVLVVRLHHTVFDDWSVDVFRRELSGLYAAAREGAASPLVEPVTTFGAFARGQRDRLAGDAGAAERAWWRRELAGAPLAVQLPIGDEAPGPAPGEPLRLALAPATVAAVRVVAPRLRATPYMTVLAAFSVVASRATGLDDLVLGTVVAHRNATDVEPLVGCFTKKVPLRLRVDGDPTFAELVARTRTALLGSLAHQDVAFEDAVQEGLGAAAAASGVAPQVSVVFQAETPRQARLTLPGVSVGEYALPAEARRERHFSAGPEGAAAEGPVWGDGAYLGTFLILSLAESADGMALVARGVFSAPAARRLLEGLGATLAELAADPSQPVSASGGGPPGHPRAGDELDVRGFRASRRRVEAALATCPGVADVAVAVHDTGDGDARLVAYVVANRPGPEPTLAGLRRALWARLPGAPWPAGLVVVHTLPRLDDGTADVDALPCPGAPDVEDAEPLAALLAAMWEELGGRPVTGDRSYWQDFSFLQVLAEAREAGLAVDDEHVLRCRTLPTLAAAIAATAAAARRTS